MSITMPNELQTVVEMLGLPRVLVDVFDIDEDEIAAFASWVKDAVGFVQDEYSLVESIFQELADHDTDTAVFKAVADAVQEFNAFLDPILEVIGTAIEIGGDALHDAIVTLKTGVLAIIVANAAPVIAALATGPGAVAVAMAQRAVMTAAIEAAVQTIKEEFVRVLVDSITTLIEQTMLTEENQNAWAQHVANLATSVAAVQVVATGARVAGGQSLAEFNDHDILQKANKLAFSFYDFKSSLDSWADEKDERANIGVGGARNLWVLAIKEVLEWIVDKVKAFGLTLMRLTIDNLVELVTSVEGTLSAADELTKVRLSQMLAEMQVYVSRVGMNPIDAPPPRSAMTLITTASRAMGTAGSDAGRPDLLDLPVSDSKPLGTVQERAPLDLTALDLPVTESRPIGVAHSDASSRVAPMDVDVKKLDLDVE